MERVNLSGSMRQPLKGAPRHGLRFVIAYCLGDEFYARTTVAKTAAKCRQVPVSTKKCQMAF
jgi:hypothetical protein